MKKDIRVLLSILVFLIFGSVEMKEFSNIFSIGHPWDKTVMAENTNKETDDCIFDQDTQTDDFLKGIEEFSGYEWNKETKQAAIQFAEADTLIITRGGCYHFTRAIEFRLRNSETDFNDMKNVFSKLSWAASLLSEEFSVNILQESIDLELYTQEEFGNKVFIYFTEENLASNNYMIYRHIDKDLTILNLSSSIN